MNPLDPHDIIEAARDLARKSRDVAAPFLEEQLAKLAVPQAARDGLLAKELQARGNLVMDCYLTGCAEMLKRLQGDSAPEPWSDDFDHEARLAELLALRTDYRTEYLNALQELGILRAECEGHRQRLAAELETKTK